MEEKLSTKTEEEKYEYLNLVNSNIKEMEGQIQKVSTDFNVLQDEMKKSLLDNKRNTILLNARQSLMMLQNEYDKKYSNRDYIRRKVIGILQSGDLNTIRSSTMETIGEEALINNPDYWLAPALLSLCAWYNNKKDLANRALNEALHRNAEMTSMLLCFIHLRAGRINTATRWLNKYLDMQVPREIDNKISLIIDALTSGIFPQNMQMITLTRIDKWLKELDNYDEYKDIYKKELDIWTDYLKETKINTSNSQFGYISDFIENGKEKINFISNLNNISLIGSNIKNIIDKKDEYEESYTNKIDKLITRLIFSHDDKEENLKIEMFKNKCLIDCYGNDEEANIIYNKKKEFIKNYNDLYSQLTRIAIYDEEVYPNSKKLAISLLGFFITTSYKDILNYDNIINEESKIINLDNIKLETIDGSNEVDLIKTLYSEKDKIYDEYIKNNKLINITNIFSVIGLILGIYLLSKIKVLGIIIIILFIGYNAYTILKKLNQRKEKQKEENIVKEKYKELLLNILSEVVDYHFLLEDIKEEIDKFINNIKSLNPRAYLKKDNSNKSIEVGVNNE